MKYFTAIFAFILFVGTPLATLRAQKPFEGTITWAMSMPGLGDAEQHPWVMNVKDKKLEIEMDMGPMAGGAIKTYVDLNTRKGYIVMGNKTGYVYDAPKDSIPSPMKQFDTAELKDLGKTEIVAGHPSKKFALAVNMPFADTMYLWATADFPESVKTALRTSFKNTQNQNEKESHAMEKLAQMGLVTDRVEIVKSGEPIINMEFKKYEEKKLDDSLFVVPSDVTFKPMPIRPGMN